jgi:hypothetical protein
MLVTLSITQQLEDRLLGVVVQPLVYDENDKPTMREGTVNRIDAGVPCRRDSTVKYIVVYADSDEEHLCAEEVRRFRRPTTRRKALRDEAQATPPKPEQRTPTTRGTPSSPVLSPMARCESLADSCLLPPGQGRALALEEAMRRGGRTPAAGGRGRDLNGAERDAISPRPAASPDRDAAQEAKRRRLVAECDVAWEEVRMVVGARAAMVAERDAARELASTTAKELQAERDLHAIELGAVTAERDAALVACRVAAPERVPPGVVARAPSWTAPGTGGGGFTVPGTGGAGLAAPDSSGISALADAEPTTPSLSPRAWQCASQTTTQGSSGPGASRKDGPTGSSEDRPGQNETLAKEDSLPLCRICHQRLRRADAVQCVDCGARVHRGNCNVQCVDCEKLQCVGCQHRHVCWT